MSGLLALLDDVAGIAKVAATSIDDVAAAAGKAGAKTAGVIIDDAAVTPKYLQGFAPARELPIIWLVQDNEWDISANAKETRAQDATHYAKGFVIFPCSRNGCKCRKSCCRCRRVLQCNISNYFCCFIYNISDYFSCFFYNISDHVSNIFK